MAAQSTSAQPHIAEPVSDNTWIYALTNGLRTEFEETRKGVLFGRTRFDTVLAIKESIINEEIVLGNSKDKAKESTKEKDSTAFAATDHSHLSCHYCGIKGHIQPDCRKKKRDEQKGDFQKGTKLYKPKGKGGKNKGSSKGKGKNKGKSSKGGNRQSNSWWSGDNSAYTSSQEGEYSHYPMNK